MRDLIDENDEAYFGKIRNKYDLIHSLFELGFG